MSKIIHDFTTKVPFWQPRVTPIDLDDATEEQRDALQVTPSNQKVSEYVLVLARDAETLKERTPLFNAIDDSTDELFAATPVEITTTAEASDD